MSTATFQDSPGPGTYSLATDDDGLGKASLRRWVQYIYVPDAEALTLQYTGREFIIIPPPLFVDDFDFGRSFGRCQFASL